MRPYEPQTRKTDHIDVGLLSSANSRAISPPHLKTVTVYEVVFTYLHVVLSDDERFWGINVLDDSFQGLRLNVLKSRAYHK